MLTENRLKILLIKTPKEIGCYLFKNKEGNIIYIGKAKNIFKRITQHFKNSAKNWKSEIMIKEIASWETFITDTEKEAFILENNLIKKYFPKFNIVLADDQTYPYIFIPNNTKHPKYFLVWKKVKQPGIYYGPFPNQYSGKEVLNLLETLFPLRRCAFSNFYKGPCFYYQINECSGACFKDVEPEYYQKQLMKVKDFFEGKVSDVKKYYQTQIEQAAKNLQFEQANKWKKIVFKIDEWIENQNVEFDNYLDGDFINYAIKNNEILIVIFFYRKGKLLLKKEGLFDLYNNNISETLEDFLQAIYTYHPLPKILFLPKDIDLVIWSQVYNVKLEYPKIGQKAQILALTLKNAETLLNYRGVLPTQANREQNLSRLSNLLKIKKIQIIEFLDLSYIDKQNIFAGFIQYQNGSPVYRKNKLYQLSGGIQNEKKHFADAIWNHYQKNPLPDLLIVDGAHSQIDGAILGFKKLNLNTNIIGLVKNDKHQTESILTINKKKIPLSKTSNIWLFLSKIQNEGHRFVNSKRSFWKLKDDFNN